MAKKGGVQPKPLNQSRRINHSATDFQAYFTSTIRTKLRALHGLL
jgi:hypothetical protein